MFESDDGVHRSIYKGKSPASVQVSRAKFFKTFKLVPKCYKCFIKDIVNLYGDYIEKQIKVKFLKIK